ncbi:GlsB/YeaQ/YmgE family stress response membrane protein [Nocardioides mangrovicus]|uniref:GlsB/YeaQ/YmgE family stress response membrane protein n=1 Tax=Nocardioides mangrovicus TaxID=2478913 RepID=A0A3L8P5Y3_9ACTN|nr:GlsB/YeaQ/YmgE family stress response membrane protein [Nocardioides mangrovicus]RLV50079.1 GlsB/YeaQ/YmgE family stress response membrane protein [Nocardioides mangrovicus]
MGTGSIFSAILAGIVIGILGRLIIPGRQAIGWILTFVLGLVGAFLGGFLAKGLSIDRWWVVLIIQAVVAAILVAVVAGPWRARHHRSQA